MLLSWPVPGRVVIRILSLVVMGVCALGPRSAVAASGHQRFTLLDAPTLKKLPAAIRANITAMVRVGQADGTGVVLDRVNGYVLTNTHLSRNRPATIRYADGTVAAVHEVLLEDAAHDQAILRVAPPTSSQVGQARLRDGVVRKGEKLYAVSAVPLLLDQNLVDLGIHRTDPQRFFAAHAGILNLGESKGATMIALANEMEQYAENRTFATIQQGRETGRGQLTQVLAGGRQIPSVPTNLPNAPGASGSPVFSARSHELVGLHYAGMPGVTWQSSEVSALTVLDEVQRAALDRSLPAATRAALAQLLATQRTGTTP